MCNVIREYRSCFYNGSEVVHGESFYHGCTARCDCDDGKLKCESFCRGYDPPLVDGCSKLRLKKEQSLCCEHWKCTERTATNTKSSRGRLIVLKSIKKGISPSKTQVDATRQSCFVDGKEILHGQKFKDSCRYFCICSNGSGLCLPLCPPTEPEQVAGCVEMHLEAVPGLCCKKWICKKYKSVDTKVSPEDLRELEANLSLNAPVVIRKHLSCFSDGSEIRYRQRFQQGCVGSCECKDGAVWCEPLCPPSLPAPVPGCTDMDEVAVPGKCCKEWKCTKYQPVDGNITVETLYHRTSEDEVDDTVYEAKRRRIREASRTVYATSDQGAASQPPAEKETQPRPLEKKEGCPKVCKCPVNPTCPPGSPLVADTCGCGCKVCAVGLDSTCDGFRPCDTSQNLTCDYLRSRMKNLGVCHADDTSVVQASSCDKEPTEWTPCSRSCGFGQSFRILYDPESCSPQAEKRLCIVRPCKSQYSNASYTVLKSSKTCNRLVRWQEPLLLNHRGCKSLYPISLRFCGDCADGRLCTPSSTETRLLGFRCRNNRSVTRRIMWVVNCQCNGKGRKKKKEENNTSEAEAEREGGLDVEEQGLKDGGFGV